MKNPARSAFLRGAARAFDLGGVLSRDPGASFEADGRAMRSDWSFVGYDIAEAIQRAEEQKDRSERPRRVGTIVRKAELGR